ncbi:MAG: DUF1287 domain-containing protein [Actinomycetia bacterium]|nr:DUF1287 domain-containing protein [Actinomycetes bacterium]
MKNRTGRKKFTGILNYRYFIYAGIIIALLQFLALKNLYQEQKIIKLPEKLFQSPVEYPIEELSPGFVFGGYDPNPDGNSSFSTAGLKDETQSSGESASGSGDSVLTDIQKQIVLRLLELLEENIEYGYEVFPDSGYPTNNIWISTDVISMVLNEAGFDLMELIYKDMSEYKEDYPMDIKGGREAIKHIDFRDVFFQEQFFKRHALELPTEYNIDDPNNIILWQPGDILYFQFDPENPYKDLGGFVSPRKNEEGVPLIIMISAELESVREVDVLMEYAIVGHYRYPPLEID